MMKVSNSSVIVLLSPNKVRVDKYIDLELRVHAISLDKWKLQNMPNRTADTFIQTSMFYGAPMPFEKLKYITSIRRLGSKWFVAFSKKILWVRQYLFYINRFHVSPIKFRRCAMCTFVSASRVSITFPISILTSVSDVFQIVFSRHLNLISVLFLLFFVKSSYINVFLDLSTYFNILALGNIPFFHSKRSNIMPRDLDFYSPPPSWLSPHAWIARITLNFSSRNGQLLHIAATQHGQYKCRLQLNNNYQHFLKKEISHAKDEFRLRHTRTPTV